MKCSIFLQVQGKSFSLLYVDCDVTNFAIEETWNIRVSLDKITCHVNLVVVIVDIGYRKFFGFCLTLLDYLKYVFGDETEFRVSCLLGVPHFQWHFSSFLLVSLVGIVTSCLLGVPHFQCHFSSFLLLFLFSKPCPRHLTF